MLQVSSIRIATFTALGALALLCGTVWAGQAPTVGAAATLEVKVLEAEVPPASEQGAPYEVRYHMEVISVLHSTLRVKPGDTLVVRSQATSQEALEKGLKPRGWIGTAALNPDPNAAGPEARWQFVDANGNGFEELPPAPPSATWIEYPREGAK